MNEWIYESEIFKKELRTMNWSLKDEKIFGRVGNHVTAQ